jgi:hypothetical protein
MFPLSSILCLILKRSENTHAETDTACSSDASGRERMLFHRMLSIGCAWKRVFTAWTGKGCPDWQSTLSSNSLRPIPSSRLSRTLLSAPSPPPPRLPLSLTLFVLICVCASRYEMLCPAKGHPSVSSSAPALHPSILLLPCQTNTLCSRNRLQMIAVVTSDTRI